MSVYFAAVLVYLSLLVLVGAWRSRAVHTQDDFLVAGRRLGVPVLVGTMLATWIGSGSIIAGAGLAYRQGLGGLWLPAGAWLGILVLYRLAPRVRAFAQYTVPDILEARYNAAARVLGTLTTVIAYTAIVSYQFRAGGYVLNLVAGVPVEQGTVLTALFVVVYTVLAGMISVAYTDVVNGAMIILGLAVGLPLMYGSVGGIEGLRAALPASRFSPLGGMDLLTALGYFVPTFLLLVGDSSMVQRLYSARDRTVARRAVAGWIVGTVVVETAIVAVAIIGAARFPGIEPETVFLEVARQGLPVAVGCLVLGAAVAIIVSTADSYLLVPATNLVRDIYQRFLRPRAAQQRLVALARALVVVLGLVAYLQLRFFETVLAMAIYAYTMYGAGITPAVLAAFLWRRATAAGGVASILGGIVGTLGWELLGRPWGIQTVFPALGLSLAGLVVASLLTPPEEARWWSFAGRTPGGCAPRRRVAT